MRLFGFMKVLTERQRLCECFFGKRSITGLFIGKPQMIKHRRVAVLEFLIAFFEQIERE